VSIGVEVHIHPALVGADETGYFVARVFGRQRGDGEWEGWLEFTPENLIGPTRVTDIETTQATRGALVFWATGLEPTYLEGALARAEPATPERATRR
jgi:hypothetical protein